MWSPYEIEIMIHHYGSRAPFPRSEAPAYSGTVTRLVQAGLLESVNESPYRATELGRGLVELWMATPVPVVKFIDPRFERSTRAELDVWLTRFKDRGGASDPIVMSDAQLGRAYSDATEGE